MTSRSAATLALLLAACSPDSDSLALIGSNHTLEVSMPAVLDNYARKGSCYSETKLEEYNSHDTVSRGVICGMSVGSRYYTALAWATMLAEYQFMPDGLLEAGIEILRDDTMGSVLSMTRCVSNPSWPKEPHFVLSCTRTGGLVKTYAAWEEDRRLTATQVMPILEARMKELNKP